MLPSLILRWERVVAAAEGYEGQLFRADHDDARYPAAHFHKGLGRNA